MRAPGTPPTLFKRFVDSFRRGTEAEWRPGQVSEEERIAAVLVVVLLATLVATAYYAYVLNYDNVRASAGTSGGVPAAARAGAVKIVRSSVFQWRAAGDMKIAMARVPTGGCS
jgi:hypothetical protein